jgi:DsbC/DsbD-like thiol-disulfide interchange protein
MWMVFELLRRNIPAMRGVIVCLSVLLSLLPAAAAGARASAWVEFREARVRIILIEPAPGESVLRGGIGFRLMPDYKTYWRNPGDSGVPPVFDFAGSKGAGDFAVHFPMPTRFDDGAGGQAWGYKTDIILPFTARRNGNEPIAIALKLDFAVCGTMCIPLVANLRLEVGQPVGLDVIEALARAESRVPKRLPDADFAARVRLEQREAGERPVYTLEIRHEAPPSDFAVFTESRGYLHIKPPVEVSPGLYRVTLKGQPPLGDDKRFGPARLTFGSKKEPYEGVLDLDGRARMP